MTPVRRWFLVALSAVLVVATPVALGRLPADGSGLSASALRQRIAHSNSLAWSGEARTRGALRIPATDSFGGLSKLLGDNNSLRVWWRDAAHWRVDRVRQTGEADLIRTGDLTTSWVFESQTATITPYSTVRLPDASDLLPSRLAGRMLAGSTKDELSRLPSRRVAGHGAAGLRLVPASARSSIDHVDVWADTVSGLPLQVEVFDAGDSRPVLTTKLTHLTLKTPEASTIGFVPPPGVKVRHRDAIDVAAGANAFAPFILPDLLIGLQRRGDPSDLGAVGAYGRGPTALLAIPLRRHLSGQVRRQLEKDVSARTTTAGTALTVGPLSVLLTPGRRGRGTFLLAGTVTPETLTQASAELLGLVELIP